MAQHTPPDNSPHATNERDLELLRSTAVAAGIIASGYFRRKIKTWTKGNLSPVSEADLIVDNYLHDVLTAARPDYGWLSEEGTDDPARLGARRVFIIDPIDGTRAFINGDDCWTISLAIVDRGEPIAGVVYAPARDELYHAVKSGGAFLNGTPINGPDEKRQAPLIPAAIAVHNELEDLGMVYERGAMLPSLAYRLVQVASGRLDAVLARRGAQDWDIAGAHVILSESGIDFSDVCAGEPLYNKPQTRHGALAAIADLTLKPQIQEALIRVYGCPDPGESDS